MSPWPAQPPSTCASAMAPRTNDVVEIDRFMGSLLERSVDVHEKLSEVVRVRPREVEEGEARVAVAGIQRGLVARYSGGDAQVRPDLVPDRHDAPGGVVAPARDIR